MEQATMPQDRPQDRPPGLDEVVQYWQGLRRGRVVPARADVDPGALAPWLSAAGIIDHAAGGRIRFRLGGQALSALLGVEARGMPLRSLFTVGARARLQDMVLSVFEGPAFLTMTLIAPAVTPGIHPVHVAMAILPLGDAEGCVNRALVCLDPKSAARAERPARFHIRQARLTPLSAARPEAPALRLITGGRG